MIYLAWHSTANHFYQLITLFKEKFRFEKKGRVWFFVFEKESALISGFFLSIKGGILFFGGLNFGSTVGHFFHINRTCLSNLMILIDLMKWWDWLFKVLVFNPSCWDWDFVFEGKFIIISINRNKLLLFGLFLLLLFLNIHDFWYSYSFYLLLFTIFITLCSLWL